MLQMIQSFFQHDSRMGVIESDLSDTVKKTVISADEIQDVPSDSYTNKESLSIETASGDLCADISMDESIEKSLHVHME